MTTSTTPQQAICTDPARAPGDVLSLVRGLLADGIRRCPPTSDAALELCTAWEHLEEPGHLPRILEPAVPGTVPTVAVLVTARDMLLVGIATIEPARRALDLAAAVRHINLALAEVERPDTHGPAAS